MPNPPEEFIEIPRQLVSVPRGELERWAKDHGWSKSWSLPDVDLGDYWSLVGAGASATSTFKDSSPMPSPSNFDSSFALLDLGEGQSIFLLRVRLDRWARDHGWVHADDMESWASANGWHKGRSSPIGASSPTSAFSQIENVDPPRSSGLADSAAWAGGRVANALPQAVLGDFGVADSFRVFAKHGGDFWARWTTKDGPADGTAEMNGPAFVTSLTGLMSQYIDSEPGAHVTRSTSASAAIHPYHLWTPGPGVPFTIVVGPRSHIEALRDCCLAIHRRRTAK